MRSRVPLLFLFVCVCVRAYGAPGVVFGGNSVTVTVPAGHSVAWIVTWTGASGLASDTDGDGSVVISTTDHSGIWAFADVETGDWTIASRSSTDPMGGWGLADRTIVRGKNGALSQLVTTGGAALWVRPGVGAWAPPKTFMEDVNGSRGDEHWIFYNATSMVPLGSSPATPTGFTHGDRLILLRFDYAEAGVVDRLLDLPPSGGTIEMIQPNYVALEGTNMAAELMRTAGADGSVTVRVRTVEETAAPNVDYEPLDRVVTFAPGETFKSIVIRMLDDQFYAMEPNHFEVTLSEPTGGAQLGEHVTLPVSIFENELFPHFELNGIPSSVTEGDVPWTVNVPITIQGRIRDQYPITFTVRESASESGPLTQTPIPLVFQQGDTRKDVSLTIPADDLPTPPRLLVLRAGGAMHYLHVNDDDPPEVRIDDVSAVEGSRRAVVTVKVPAVPGIESSLRWSTVEGTAKVNSDFRDASGYVTLNSTTKEFSIELLDDGTSEATETFYVDISDVQGPVINNRRRITVTIYDDEVATPAVTIVPVSVVEGHTGTRQTDVRVQLASALPSSAVSLMLVSTGVGTASPHTDYTPVSQVVEFPPGVTERVVPVLIAGDEIDEQDETFELVAKEQNTVRATARITIVDDDGLSFSGVQDVTVEEHTGTSVHAVFRVTLSPAPEAQATIDYSTSDVTAIAGADYVAKSGTLTFAKGQTAAEIRVEILGDSIVEPAESFALQLSNPVGTYLQGNRAVATIFDDDAPAPAVSVVAVSVVEGDSGPTQAALKVKLASSVTHTVRFILATTGTGSASSADYQALNEAVTFEPGQTEVTVNAIILGDTIDEDDETFGIEVRHGGTVKATATVTIVDDDTPLSIRVADVTVQEKTGPSTSAVFRITVAPAPVTIISVSITTADGTAVAGSDYLPLSGTALFFPGEAQRDVSVEVFGDSTDESNETFTLQLSNAIGATIVDDRGTATIIDDDDSTPPAVWIDPVSITEGHSGQKQVAMHVHLGAASTTPVTLTVQSDGTGTATASQDYLPLSTSITFAPGQTDLVVNATILGDTTDENHETFIVVAHERAALRAVGVVTILDDDTAAAPVFSVADTTVAEKTGTSAFATFRITLSPPPAGNASVAYATHDGTATAGADYLATSGTLQFTAGQASRDVTVEVFGDAITEVDETFVLRLSNPIGGDLPFITALALIIDDDAPITPSVSVADVEVRESEGLSDATFTLTLSKAMTTPVKVSFGTVEHTAAPRTDYEEKSGNVTFAPGELTRTVTVRIIGDRVPEEREMFRLELRSSEGAPIADGSALCTIIDDDAMTKRRTARH